MSFNCRLPKQGVQIALMRVCAKLEKTVQDAVGVWGMRGLKRFAGIGTAIAFYRGIAIMLVGAFIPIAGWIGIAVWAATLVTFLVIGVVRAGAATPVYLRESMRPRGQQIDALYDTLFKGEDLSPTELSLLNACRSCGPMYVRLFALGVAWLLGLCGGLGRSIARGVRCETSRRAMFKRKKT